MCLTGAEPIRADDSYGSLAARLQSSAESCSCAPSTSARRSWSSPRMASPTPRRSAAEDRLLDPARPAIELERVVRALHPHIGARVALADGSLLRGAPRGAPWRRRGSRGGAGGRPER